MSVLKLLARVRLTAAHVPTGKTRHYIGVSQSLMPKPTELRIAQYEAGADFFLLYCDAAGIEMTDTWHDSLDAAMSQAEWEFGVQPDEWERPQ